jgi:ABC-type Zn uptake system ZnuABC Zn-binding protein ZnuA/ABC-type Mn2+/Zn2+ transport system permease subunit
VFEPFQFVFVQRGVLEIALLSVGAGLIGTWVVLRGLAFYSHAVGTAAFPGLVVADGVGFSPLLGAFGAAAVFAVAVTLLARSRRTEYGNFTALVLVGALALGVILASDVFHSGSNVETLLFGSLLLVGTRDLVLAAAFSLLALAASVVLGRRWLATGFDPQTVRALGARSPLSDALLLALVGFGAIAAITSLGALLVSALLVVPAATARLWTRSLRMWQLVSVALVLLEGVIGIWISVEANVPPGAAIAVLAGGVFVVAALARTFAPGRVAAAAAALTALALLVGGCGPAASGTQGSADISAVATTTQIGDWARAVGGSAVTVHQILQPNTDPHEYEPRPLDVEATAGADAVLENGDRLDNWMNKVISQAGGHPRVLDLGTTVPVREPGETSGPEASRFDPHWWHDPRNAAAAVRAIRDAFVRAEPKHKALFDRNAAAYLARLSRLDRGIAACFGKLPSTQRKLVTDHDAFGYFAHRYGITVVGAVIPSQTTQAQPSAGDTAKLVALVRREHVKAIFPESSLNKRLADAVARETGASSAYTLYGDTLGPKDSPGATYLGMEAANADAMVQGMSGGAERCAPAGG